MPICCNQNKPPEKVSSLAIVSSEGWVRHALANTGLDQLVPTHATLDEALGHGGRSL